MCVLAVRTPEIRNEAEKFVWKGAAVKKSAAPACSLTLWKEWTQLWRTLQNIMKSRLKTILFALALLVLTADGSPSPPLLRSKRQTQCKKKKLWIIETLLLGNFRLHFRISTPFLFKLTFSKTKVSRKMNWERRPLSRLYHPLVSCAYFLWESQRRGAKKSFRPTCR